MTARTVMAPLEAAPPPTPYPHLSVLVVNWNTRELLRQCLESVYRTVVDTPFEVIVVDNHSTDGSVAMLREQFPHVRIIENETNYGFAYANNQAITIARGDHLLLLNSDTILHEGTIDRLTALLQAHPSVGMVGPRLLNHDGTLQPSWAQFPTVLSEVLGKNFRGRRAAMANDGTIVYDVDWIGGACLLVRRAVVEHIGLLDERFFMYSEETDWCFRTKRAGWNVWYVPRLTIVHLGGQSSKKSNAAMHLQLYKSKIMWFRKHRGAGRTAVLIALLETVCLSRLVRAAVTHRLRRPDRRAPGGSARSTSTYTYTYKEYWSLMTMLGRQLRPTEAPAQA